MTDYFFCMFIVSFYDSERNDIEIMFACHTTRKYNTQYYNSPMNAVIPSRFRSSILDRRVATTAWWRGIFRRIMM